MRTIPTKARNGAPPPVPLDIPHPRFQQIPLSGNTKGGKYHSMADLLFDWFLISCMTTDNFCFYLQHRLIQTSQTGGQRYSDTSPFGIPCCYSSLFVLWRKMLNKRDPCLVTDSLCLSASLRVQSKCVSVKGHLHTRFFNAFLLELLFLTLTHFDFTFESNEHRWPIHIIFIDISYFT